MLYNAVTSPNDVTVVKGHPIHKHLYSLYCTSIFNHIYILSLKYCACACCSCFAVRVIRGTRVITPRAHARARGYVIGRGVHILSGLFLEPIFYLQKYFEMSILTQIGFSSNLMASGTVKQLDKSSWPSQIPIVCRLGKGSPMPETHIAPNHTPTIADFVPKWLNTPTLLYLASLQLLRPLDTTRQVGGYLHLEGGNRICMVLEWTIG